MPLCAMGVMQVLYAKASFARGNACTSRVQAYTGIASRFPVQGRRKGSAAGRVLDAVALLGALAVVKAIERADEVAGDAAEPVEWACAETIGDIHKRRLVLRDGSLYGDKVPAVEAVAPIEIGKGLVAVGGNAAENDLHAVDDGSEARMTLRGVLRHEVNESFLRPCVISMLCVRVTGLSMLDCS